MSLAQPQKAFQACLACRRLKRRCTKDLPACALCIRLKKDCQYAGLVNNGCPGGPANDGGVISASPGTASANRPLFQEFTRPQQLFPPSFFLDTTFMTSLSSDSLAWGHQPSLEQYAADHIGPDRLALCEEYLAGCHRWFPFISKKRLLKDVGDNSGTPDGGLTLLLLCLKLSTTVVSNGQPSSLPLYLLIRALCSAAESSGSVSLRLVQSLLLLSVFEFSHAIYPAAFIDIARTARLGLLMGMPDRKGGPALFKPSETWTLREENRRTWWAIFILDRCASVESNGVPFACPDPASEQLLPVNDEEWEKGGIVPSEALYTTSFSNVTNRGCFAKMCQAAHLLSKVIQHAQAWDSVEPTDDTSRLASEALQLHRTLIALQTPLEESHSSQEAETGLTALSICVSARFILYDKYGCTPFSGSISHQPNPEETQMQNTSLDGIRALTKQMVPKIALSEASSPLVTRCLYEAATQCSWLIQEDHEPEMYEALRKILAGLRIFGERWGVAGEYMDLLQQDGVLKLNNLDLVVVG